MFSRREGSKFDVDNLMKTFRKFDFATPDPEWVNASVASYNFMNHRLKLILSQTRMGPPGFEVLSSSMARQTGQWAQGHLWLPHRLPWLPRMQWRPHRTGWGHLWRRERVERHLWSRCMPGNAWQANDCHPQRLPGQGWERTIPCSLGGAHAKTR